MSPSSYQLLLGRWTASLAAVVLLPLSPVFATETGPPEPGAKPSPEKLWELFEKTWEAREQGTALGVARQLADLRDGAAPLIPQMVSYLKKMPRVETLEGTEIPVRTGVAKILASIGPDAAVALAKTIGEGDIKVSRPVTYVLPGSTTVIGKEAKPDRTDEFYPSAITVSYFETMAEAFDLLAFEAEPTIPILAGLFTHRSPEVRAQACRCLGSIGPLAASVLPQVRAVCRAKDAKCRAQALRTLALLEVDVHAVLPALETALADPSAEVRMVALELIRYIGSEAERTLGPLLEMLKRADFDPGDLRRAQGQVLFHSIDGFEIGAIVLALKAVGLRTVAQCDILGELLANRRGRINRMVKEEITQILWAAGEPAQGAARKVFLSCPPRDKEALVDALRFGLALQPTPPDLLPQMIETLLGLWKETVLVKDPALAKRFASFSSDGPKPSAFDESVRDLGFRPRALDGITIPILFRLEQAQKYPAGTTIRCIEEATYEKQPLDLKFATNWLIERLAETDTNRSFAISALGLHGPPAFAAVPALEPIAKEFTYTEEAVKEDRYDPALRAWIALARITGEVDEWLTEAETRFLLPAIESRAFGRHLNSYFAEVNSLGLKAMKWAQSPEQGIVDTARTSMIYLGMLQPETARDVLPTLLKAAATDPKMVNDIYFIRVIAHAQVAAVGAWPLIKPLLETYASQTADEAERAMLSKKLWSRYSMSSSFSGREGILDLFAAAQAIGLAGQAEVAPLMLKLYENEPLKGEDSLRPDVLELLRTLGIDLTPLAHRWVPQVTARLKESYPVKSYFQELATFGPAAREVALPETLRFLRLDRSSTEAIIALIKMEARDPRTKSLLHCARFNPESPAREAVAASH